MKFINKIIICIIFFKTTISMESQNLEMNTEQNIFNNLCTTIKDNNISWVIENIGFCKNLITKPNHEDLNPIELTIIHGRLGILQLFVQNNLADVMLKNKSGKTPLDLARDSGKKEFINYLNEITENHKKALIKIALIKKHGNYNPFAPKYNLKKTKTK